jgi:peroxiredoxin
MALTYSKQEELGKMAPDFALKGADGKTYRLLDFKDAKAIVVVFMCNHCPYVIATQGRINALAKEYGPRGVKVIGINSNDVEEYPEDSLEEMTKRSREQGFVFPYLWDETQEVAKAYDAACTPDPYVFERTGNQFVMRYHGRIDDNWKDEKAVTRRELAEALDAVLAGKPVNPDQKPAMGCNIKWKA